LREKLTSNLHTTHTHTHTHTSEKEFITEIKIEILTLNV